MRLLLTAFGLRIIDLGVLEPIEVEEEEVEELPEISFGFVTELVDDDDWPSQDNDGDQWCSDTPSAARRYARRRPRA